MQTPPLNQILHGLALDKLRALPDNSVDCCVTSPPYWALRDYGVEGQLGLEETPELFVERITEIFNEVRRVLASHGTLWINLGDSYAANGKNRSEDQAVANSTLKGGKNNKKQVLKQKSKIADGLKPKDLVPTKKAVKTAVIDKRDETADTNDQGSNRQKDGHKPGYAYAITDKGCFPACKCKAKSRPGIVLDPFMGAGTTALVARKLNRNFIGIELNADYIKIAEKRLYNELGAFAK